MPKKGLVTLKKSAKGTYVSRKFARLQKALLAILSQINTYLNNSAKMPQSYKHKRTSDQTSRQPGSSRTAVGATLTLR